MAERRKVTQNFGQLEGPTASECLKNCPHYGAKCADFDDMLTGMHAIATLVGMEKEWSIIGVVEAVKAKLASE